MSTSPPTTSIAAEIRHVELLHRFHHMCVPQGVLFRYLHHPCNAGDGTGQLVVPGWVHIKLHFVAGKRSLGDRYRLGNHLGGDSAECRRLYRIA